MRPQWRLAISSLSERRSRTILLVATVALSAALIAAVACTMNSMQESAKRQAEQTVGTADAWIKPAGRGKPLDASLLELARGWGEVGRSEGTLEAPVSASVEMAVLEPAGEGGLARVTRTFRATAMAMGSADVASLTRVSLAEGRHPRDAGEVVIDASMAEHLSFLGPPDRRPFHATRRDGKRLYQTGEHPSIPASTRDAGEARALNERVGLRVGDELRLARQAIPDVNIAAILSDPKKAAEMAAQTGATLSIESLRAFFQKPIVVRVVGISVPPPFGGRYRMFGALETVSRLTQSPDQLSRIDLTLRPGVDAEEFVRARSPTLPDGVLLQTSAKVTSGLDRQILAGRLGFVLATMMAFFAAAFIIATAMTTGVTERLRELGMLRCIGAGRGQLAGAQLLAGLVIGVSGAAVGVPLGLALAALIVQLLQTRVEVSMSFPAWGLGLAGGGAVLCGVLAAGYPAWRAGRVSPLAALASRAQKPGAGGVVKLLVISGASLLTHIAIVTLTRDGQWRFWLYVTLGIALHFVGYFALAVPAMLLVTKVFSGVLSRALSLPAHVLSRTIRATPYRYGFTAGSMMLGLSLLVGIWTQGGAIQRDWFGSLQFPDAFVTGLNLSAQSQRTVDALPFVERTCAITLQAVETGSFGVRALENYSSTFLAFEPEPFFAMVQPTWVQGDPGHAISRLNAGGAVIVAREFTVARGLGLGDTIVCSANGRSHAFEIVGVVTSPGLELISQFFNIGQDFTEQSLHAVFGTRQDLLEKFGSDAIHLIQIQLRPGTSDAEAVRTLNETLAGAGILDAGSGRAIREHINDFISGALLGVSSISILAMAIAGLGVANLIVAGITARQYEFGVLQAVGAGRGLVVRLVLAEALLISITACVLGTAMGLQGTFAVQRIDRLLFGLVLHLKPPIGPIAVGWLATVLLTLVAAAPAAAWLSRKTPRELLGSLRG
jgi:putative ABC transport system permease protein